MRLFAPLNAFVHKRGREQDAFKCSSVSEWCWVYQYWSNITPYCQYWTNMNHMTYDNYNWLRRSRNILESAEMSPRIIDFNSSKRRSRRRLNSLIRRLCRPQTGFQLLSLLTKCTLLRNPRWIRPNARDTHETKQSKQISTNSIGQYVFLNRF